MVSQTCQEQYQCQQISKPIRKQAAEVQNVLLFYHIVSLHPVKQRITWFIFNKTRYKQHKTQDANYSQLMKT